MITDKYHSGRFTFKTGAMFLLMFTALLGLTSCSSSDLSFPTEYQAVYLDNNQVFFGKITETNTPFPMLRDVFFVQTQVDQQKKETKHLLIRRGVEGHGPDFMRLNAQHIVVIEPVAPDSRVAQLIREAKTPRPPEATKEVPKPPAAK
ncbi:MAG: hypothetical protein M0P73_18275 [Syntrophobacterales bacterium]|jgi:hypothetical protein|nr:hypothetical protein [Syntrophobacterales bacterium]